MQRISARVTSVHAGSGDGLSKSEQAQITIELDGVAGDRHQSFERVTWAGDKQPKGTRRRNERQWSAVSVEELAAISETLELTEPLSATTLGANLCVQGIRDFSKLPKGTTLTFPSGAVLVVEEYNPPCGDMGEKIAAIHETRSGEPLAATAFSKAAKLSRGLVGVVDVPGRIRAGDEVTVALYDTPTWLLRSPE